MYTLAKGTHTVRHGILATTQVNSWSSVQRAEPRGISDLSLPFCFTSLSLAVHHVRHTPHTAVYTSHAYTIIADLPWILEGISITSITHPNHVWVPLQQIGECINTGLPRKQRGHLAKQVTTLQYESVHYKILTIT